MEALLNRYRNLTVLLIVIFGQLVMIAYQVRTGKDVPLLRVWAVTAVTPVEQALEFVRRNTIGVAADYFVLMGVRAENDRLKRELGELKLKNQYLETELSTADRAKALLAFQSHSPSKTLAARIIGNGTGSNSRVVFVDRGSASGVESGMAVITPDGIVGKVLEAYPTASLVMLVTDPTFAAGVVSQNNHVHGTLKGQGHSDCTVDFVQNEQKVESGEWFYTSGDDRIFPRGLPAGKVVAVRNGKTFKEIYVSPSAFQSGLDEVLIVLQGVHQAIPETEAAPGYKLMPPPPDEVTQNAGANSSAATLNTQADKIKAEYKQVGEAEKHVFGEGNKPPDFTKLGQRLPQTPGAQGPPVSKPPITVVQPTAAPGTTPVPKPVATKPPITVGEPAAAAPVAPKPKPPITTELDEFGQPKPAAKPKPATPASQQQ